MAVLRHIGIACIFFLALSRPVSAYQQIDFVREIGEAGKDRPRLLSSPRSLTITGDKLFIADTDNHRILVIDRNGKNLFTWGTKGNKPGQFKSPSGIAVDEHGLVYVADTGNHRIQVLDGEGTWIRSIGTKGDGAREFNSPAGIAVSNGFVYIADTGNSRVQVLTADGIFVKLITVKLAKDEMKSPVGIAVDVQNRLMVLDSGANKVRVFDPSGSQVLTFGSRGSGSSEFEKPQGIAVDMRGNVFVADTGNFKIKKFDEKGRLVGSTGSQGDKGGQFREATGMTVDPEGRVWVLDAGKNTVQAFITQHEDARPLSPASPLPTVAFSREMRSETAALAINNRAWGIVGDSLTPLGIYEGRTIGSRGSGPAFFKNPRGLAVDDQSNFWVADTGNDRLQKFSLEGNLLQVIGKSGTAEGEFRSPYAVAVSPKGVLCVADTGNRRVQVFNAKGLLLGSFGKAGKQAGQFNEITDIAVDAEENIFVVDRGNDRIAKYDSNGGLLWEKGTTGKQDGEFKGPENIAVSPDGEVYVLDAGNARVQVFDSKGSFLRKFGSEGPEAGQFQSPQGLTLQDGLYLYVGDRGNRRVQVFLLKQTPDVPKELSALARVNEIQLSWKANVETYLDLYKIYRSDSPSGPFNFIGTAASPFYLDKNLKSNHTYYYRISSRAREGNESAPTGIVSAVTPKLVPERPKSVRIEPSEKQITLSWLPNLEPFVSYYRVYRTSKMSRSFELLTRTEKTTFSDGPLPDDTLYYYQITAVGKEEDESPPSEAVFASTPRAQLKMPPLEITKIEAGEIFASAYKYYESHPLGKVTITNTTDTTFLKLKLSFSIKGYMDYPTETEIPGIAPMQQVVLPLTPLFNNKILEVTENTPLQSEVALTFYAGGEPRTVRRSFPLTLFERHAMRWDHKTKIGAFVTHKDPVVADFSRLVVQQYVDAYPNLPDAVVYARGIYDALGVLGLKYIVDPTSPYTEFSGSATAVDYLQYPRDTLIRKSGDCDDLAVLFAACLENIGIGAAFVDVPGHLFVMFNTGVPEKDKHTLGFPNELLVLSEGTVWIPLEMTMVGASFTRAWQKGAEEYRDWMAKRQAYIINVQKAWDEFKAVTLPSVEMSVKVRREDIEAAYKDELEALGRHRLANLSAGYRDILKKNPKDLRALGQLGIIYGENGLYAEALEQFKKMLALEKTNAMALNNIGNISFLQGRFDDARQAYTAALAASPGEPGIMVNLARVALRSGKKEEAKKLFQDAAAIDPRVIRQYSDLASGLGIMK